MPVGGIIALCLFIGIPVFCLIMIFVEDEKLRKRRQTPAYWQEKMARYREYTIEAEHEIQKLARLKAAREGRPPTAPADIVRPDES